MMRWSLAKRHCGEGKELEISKRRRRRKLGYTSKSRNRAFHWLRRTESYPTR